MPDSALLLVGPPSPLRDSYELALRRHAADVVLCEDCTTAQHWTQSGAVQTVIVMPHSSEEQVEQFVQSVRREQPHIPVIHAGGAGNESLSQVLLQHGAVVLPANLPADQIEHIFAPLSAPAPKARIRLHRREYPLNFKAARALFETEFLTRALERERGIVSRAARVIGVGRRYLQNRIVRLGIDVRRIRRES